jgi:uncharacterized protein
MLQAMKTNFPMKFLTTFELIRSHPSLTHSRLIPVIHQLSNMRLFTRFLLLIGFCGLPFLALAKKEVPPKPSQLVSDYANLLSTDQKMSLERKLRAYNDSTSSQIVVVLDRSLEGEDVFDYAMKLARSWGIGQAEKDNGILVYIVAADRKIQILTGKGLQGALPDVIIDRIIRQEIAPAFGQKRYYEGLDRATTAMIKYATGEFKAGPKEDNSAMTALFIVFGIVLLIMLFLYFTRNRGGGNNGGGYYRGGSYEYDSGRGGWIFLPGGGGFSGNDNGGGGSGWDMGDFGGFGGGDFDGGGADGDW